MVDEDIARRQWTRLKYEKSDLGFLMSSQTMKAEAFGFVCCKKWNTDSASCALTSRNEES